MIEYERKNLNGVPDYTAAEFEGRRSDYCLLIPVINEGARILTELGRAENAGINKICDIVICDGGNRCTGRSCRRLAAQSRLAGICRLAASLCHAPGSTGRLRPL